MRRLRVTAAGHSPEGRTVPLSAQRDGGSCARACPGRDVTSGPVRGKQAMQLTSGSPESLRGLPLAVVSPNVIEFFPLHYVI